MEQRCNGDDFAMNLPLARGYTRGDRPHQPHGAAFKPRPIWELRA